MSGTDVTLTDLLEQTIAKAAQSMDGPVIGRVEAYDAVNARVSIKPLVPLLVDGDIIPASVLPAVPVAWPGSTTHSDRWPIAAGSYMELTPLGHDHDGWMTTGTPDVRPVTDRKFSLADLVAKPLSPSPLATPPNPLSYDAAWRVLFGPTVVGDNTGTLVALASLVKAQLDAIQLAYDTHTHPTAPTGPVSVPSNIIGTIGNVACTQLKAK